MPISDYQVTSLNKSNTRPRLTLKLAASAEKPLLSALVVDAKEVPDRVLGVLGGGTDPQAINLKIGINEYSDLKVKPTPFTISLEFEGSNVIDILF